MAEPANVGRPVGSLPVANRDFNNLQILFRSAEQQIKVPEGVELSEIGPIPANPFVVASIQYFGATERVFDRLTQE